MNLWQRFNALNEQRPILIGTVVGTADWNQSVIAWPNGSQQTVSGGGTVGTRYFITRTEDLSGWRLDGEAPALAFLVIEV